MKESVLSKKEIEAEIRLEEALNQISKLKKEILDLQTQIKTTVMTLLDDIGDNISNAMDNEDLEEEEKEKIKLFLRKKERLSNEKIVDDIIENLENGYIENLIKEIRELLDGVEEKLCNNCLQVVLDIRKKSKKLVDLFELNFNWFKAKLIEKNLEQSDLEIKAEKLKKEVYFDFLTGAFNRRSFNNHMKLELKNTIVNKDVLSIAILDIDHFKDVNDRFGHNCGDKVLIGFVKFIKEKLIEKNKQENIRRGVKGKNFMNFYRAGGEEFVILSKLDQKNLETFVKKCLCDFKHKAFMLKGKDRYFSFSGGITSYMPNKHGELTKEQIVEKADCSLYAAKGRGRSMIVSDIDLTPEEKTRLCSGQSKKH